MTVSPTNTIDAPLPLGQVINLVKGWVEKCGWVWVQAEVIQLTRRNAPTQFLTLRDKKEEFSATVTCTRVVLDAAGAITEGATVLALVTPRVFAKNTRLTFECAEIQLVGEGQLLAQLENLKRKLQAEGLFDPSHKKPLPVLPAQIGLITGADSAAERDVLTNICNRWPAAQIVVRHSLVQGPQAAAQVMDALSELDADSTIDVIIIARGGGSLEDLLPFSDEGLVRAVYRTNTPVVSAIGHEPDTPILDYVADVRASTPTDAAKRVVPDIAELHKQIDSYRDRIRQGIVSRISYEVDWLAAMRQRPVLRDPTAGFDAHYERIDSLIQRARRATTQTISTEATWVSNALATVQRMSPKATLERGYAIVSDADGTNVTSVHDVEPGDQLQLYLSDGELVVEVDYQEEE